jgi:aminoglycoside 6-adenylyltransferase
MAPVTSIILDRIIELGNKDEDIRAVILEGSLAVNTQVDELSDYDINIFATHYEKYINDDSWLSQIGEVMLYQKEQIIFYGAVVPSHLVLFRDRQRVDFSYWDVSLLSEMVQGDKVYESYKNGYQIMVDKDHLAQQLKPPSGDGFAISPPQRYEFLETIYGFWFEAYCVAKYLSRQDLWYAKLIENSYIKTYLFRMALWNHQAENSWKPDPLIHLEGKRFEKWAPAELIESVARCFSPYRVDDTWDSLYAMVELFNRLARQTASQLDIVYPVKIEGDVLNYLEFLKYR